MKMLGSEIKAFWGADWDALAGRPVHLDHGGIFDGDFEISHETVENYKSYLVFGSVVSDGGGSRVCSLETLVRRWRLVRTSAYVVLLVGHEQVADVLAVARERGWKVEKDLLPRPRAVMTGGE